MTEIPSRRFPQIAATSIAEPHLFETTMKPSHRAIELIKQFEGLRLHAYPDPGTGDEPWTIGYGHTGDVHSGDEITEHQADVLLEHDAGEAGADVESLVRVPLSQNQFDALTSFTFNLGARNLERSTLLRLLNTRNYDAAANQFRVWVMAGGKHLPGLIKRRAAERALFVELPDPTTPEEA